MTLLAARVLVSKSYRNFKGRRRRRPRTARGWLRLPALLESSSPREEPEAESYKPGPGGFGWSTFKRKGRDRIPEEQKGPAPESGIEVWELAAGGLDPRRC